MKIENNFELPFNLNSSVQTRQKKSLEEILRNVLPNFIPKLFSVADISSLRFRSHFSDSVLLGDGSLV